MGRRKKGERVEAYKEERKEIRMKGVDSGKEVRRKEKRVIKGNGRGDG